MSDSNLTELSKRVLSLGLGMATLTKEKAEEIVNEMIQKGEVKRTEAHGFLKAAKARGKEMRVELQGVVEERVERSLRTVRLAVQSDLRKIEKRLTRLEARFERLERGKSKKKKKKSPNQKKASKSK